MLTEKKCYFWAILFCLQVVCQVETAIPDIDGCLVTPTNKEITYLKISDFIFINIFQSK